MKILKLSDLETRLDKNGTLSIIANKDLIVKISAAEIISISLESLKRTLGESLSIPVDILNKINETIILHENKKSSENSTKKCLTTDKENNMIMDRLSEVQEKKQKEELLLSFISQFVNENSEENTFLTKEIERASSLSLEESLRIIKQKGFAVLKSNKQLVKISLNSTGGLVNVAEAPVAYDPEKRRIRVIP